MNVKAKRCYYTVWDGKLDIYVTTVGEGPDLIYFAPSGLIAVDPFIESLSACFTVHAIELPGTSAEQPNAGMTLRDLWDLVLVMEEVIDRLVLDQPPVVGVSIGAMVAAELGATFPRLFSSLSLISPVGMWRDDEPLPNWQAEPSKLADLLFADPRSPAALNALALDQPADETIALRAGQVWSLGCIGRHIWPIPDRGLSGRLHRVAAPTLVIRGDGDDITPISYAEDIVQAIGHAKLVSVASAKHLPEIEQPSVVLELIRSNTGRDP